MAGHVAHQVPEEPRAVVLDHQGHRSLVEPVVLRGEPPPVRAVAGVEAGVEAGEEPVRADDFRIGVAEVPQRGQDDLRREGQGRDDRPGRQRPIIGSERDSPGHVAVELPLDASFAALLREAGAGPGGDAPAVLAVPFEPLGIAQRVLLLDQRSPGGCSRSSQSRFSRMNSSWMPRKSIQTCESWWMNSGAAKRKSTS